METYVDTDTETVDSERAPNRIEIDFRSTCYEKIPLWKSWASKGKVQEAIDQLLFLEKQTRPRGETDTTARILVAIVQIYFDAKNWPALNEQILLLAKKRLQPKQAIVKMVQECLTYVEKLPDKQSKIKLIETLSFITEGRPYLEAETTSLIKMLTKINKEKENIPRISEPINLSETLPENSSENGVPGNFTDSVDPENFSENVDLETLSESFVPEFEFPLNIGQTRERQAVTPKKRKPLSPQSKEMIYNLYKYFNEIKGKDMTTICDTASSRLVAMSTGLPWSSVKKVMLEGKRMQKGEQEPNFTAPNIRKRKFPLNDSETAVVRESIIDYYYDCYDKDENFPTLQSFHEQIKNKIKYSGSFSSIRKELQLMGFNWKITSYHSGILVEKHEIRFLRINFLSKIAEYRAQGRPIVYTGETFIDTSNRPKGTTKGPGLVIVHAGGKDGYIPNALKMFEAKENTDINLPYLTSEDYIKWINTQLIPNLKPNSVVVIDKAFYQNLLQNPAPGPNSRKQEMLDWLDYRNIVHSSSMLKPQLYQLILQHKEKCKEYKIDSILRNVNHGVLRLPPHHPELNPIRNIWPLIKQGMGKKKYFTNKKQIMKLAEENINLITKQQWKNQCEIAIRNERKFIGHDSAIDTITEKISSNASDSSEESDTELAMDYPHLINE